MTRNININININATTLISATLPTNTQATRGHHRNKVQHIADFDAKHEATQVSNYKPSKIFSLIQLTTCVRMQSKWKAIGAACSCQHCNSSIGPQGTKPKRWKIGSITKDTTNPCKHALNAAEFIQITTANRDSHQHWTRTVPT